MNAAGIRLPLPEDENDRYVDSRFIANRLGISLATFWRRCKDKTFPAPLDFGKGTRTTRWHLAEVLAWEATRRSEAKKS
jgi:predicted DNA-binding transcriptional regulator AlpA